LKRFSFISDLFIKNWGNREIADCIYLIMGHVKRGALALLVRRQTPHPAAERRDVEAQFRRCGSVVAGLIGT
jgi:hypothetical protein